MKIKRSFYYGAVLGGTTLLIFSSGFEVPELAMALGFVLLMAGLYGLNHGRRAPDNNAKNTDEQIQDRGQGSADR
jgi:hypothetical protein